jgi:dTDP-4-dehydrorhamnose reductase
MIQTLKPSAVVNCAALANVDECERSPERAHLVNVALPQMLAEACSEAGVAFAHVSTDMVFDGKRGNYKETDEPRPLNVYAASKLAGEQAVGAVMREALILRTNFIGMSPTPGAGLAEWIADRLDAGDRINGFTDVIVSPLFAGELARLILRMIDKNLSGVYHLGAADSVSKYDLAYRIAEACDVDGSLIDEARVADAGLTAPRPLDISLDSSRAESALGEALPTVQDGVDAFAKLRRSRKMRPGTEAKIPT